MTKVELTSQEIATQELIDAFSQQYGEDGQGYLNLARYAAFPLVLTPDLLYQIWAIFWVKETPWIAVAHILLSPLCQEIGYETYEMELETRNQLLGGLNEEQLMEMGQFMLQYLKKRMVGTDPHTQNIKERQKITALTYTQPSLAAKELAQKLSQGIKSENIREAFRWTTFVKTLAKPLIEKGFEPLLTYNDIILNTAYQRTNTSEHNALVQKFERQKSAFSQKIKLKDSLTLPSDNASPSLSTQLNIKLTTFDINVATIVFDDDLKPKEEEKAQLWEFETIFVNRRGETIKTQPCEAYYYKEPLDFNNLDEASENSEVEGDNNLDGEATPTVEPLTMIYIPEGEFIMGSHSEEKNRYDNESPQHRVKISPFFMAQTPITQAQWRAIASLPQVERELNTDPSSFKGDENPVDSINWYDAIECCARLSKYTGREYRLPSEAEWEYACRGFERPPVDVFVVGKSTAGNPVNTRVYPPFHFGDTITDKLANYSASSTYANEPKGEYRNKTTPVRSFKPNAFGLYDMHGNVFEWCLDPWNDSYNGAPTDGRVWDKEHQQEDYYAHIVKNIKQMLTDERSRVVRGGSWIDDPYQCRSASRYYDYPRDDDFPYSLRVVCCPPRTS
ncbi:MAG: formylglycine-generating enzyme family protein [Crocosphaera sp.]